MRALLAGMDESDAEPGGHAGARRHGGSPMPRCGRRGGRSGSPVSSASTVARAPVPAGRAGPRHRAGAARRPVRRRRGGATESLDGLAARACGADRRVVVVPRDRGLRQSQGRGEALLGEDVVERGAPPRSRGRCTGRPGRCLRTRYGAGASAICRMIEADSGIGGVPAGIVARLDPHLRRRAPELRDAWALRRMSVSLARAAPAQSARYEYCAGEAATVDWASGRTGFRRRTSRAFETAQAALGQWPIARRMPRFLPSGQFSTRARPCPTRIASQ